MPLLRVWDCNPHSRAAIWKVTEPEIFFWEQTELQTELKSEKRRLEFLAGRFLLKYLQPTFPLAEIIADSQDKPRIPHNHFFFSISHSFPFIAAVVSETNECGIDIQVWHKRMLDLQHKFLSVDEQSIFKNDSKLITLAWCAKEAAYKRNGKRGVDFIKQLPIKQFEERTGKLGIMVDNAQKIFLQAGMEEDYAWSVVV